MWTRSTFLGMRIYHSPATTSLPPFLSTHPSTCVTFNVLVRVPGVGEERPQRWFRCRPDGQTVHVGPWILAVAARQLIQLLEQLVQLMPWPQSARMPALLPDLLRHLEPLQQGHDLLLEVPLLHSVEIERGTRRIRLIRRPLFIITLYLSVQHHPLVINLPALHSEDSC